MYCLLLAVVTVDLLVLGSSGVFCICRDKSEVGIEILPCRTNRIRDRIAYFDTRLSMNIERLSMTIERRSIHLVLVRMLRRTHRLVTA